MRSTVIGVGDRLWHSWTLNGSPFNFCNSSIYGFPHKVLKFYNMCYEKHENSLKQKGKISEINGILWKKSHKCCSMFQNQSINQYIYLPTYLSICLSICPPTHPFVLPCICLPACLPIHPYIYIYVCVCVCVCVRVWMNYIYI